MITNSIVKKAIEEIESPQLGMTKQFLKIHEIVYDDNKPQVEKVAQIHTDKIAKVYFPVVGQKFYLCIYIDTFPDLTVSWAETEPRVNIYFRATSDSLNYAELCALTILKPTDGWNKGDKREFGNSVYKFSSVDFYASTEPDTFEDKLSKLLDLLEQDKEGVRILTRRAKGHIQTFIYIHNGNGMLGGPHIDKNSIKRLSALNLTIDFDIYAQGNLFK